MKIYYTIFIIILIISSCTEVIDLELNTSENNKLVVEGSITTEQKSHTVKLSRTTDYFSNQATPKELGAKLSISDDENIFYLTDDDNDGIYITDENVKGQAGKTYRLDIELENGEKYFAESFLKPIFPMDSLKYEYKKSDFPFDENYYYSIYLYVQEPPSIGDYYQWELYINGIHDSDTLRNKTIVSDEMVNGVYISKWPVYVIPDYKILNDTNMVKIQMLSISKEAYDFELALILETDYSGSNFSGPPANIPTNISNGALGFFSASDIVEDSIEVYYKKNVNSNKKISSKLK
ncbi:MAG: DUF4249 domain-containing protein [Bacteroidales bacterium]|nr:DUF4249 domain-containing protein [Bacteroidales bacterium]MBN2756318.1 DUF4249 domain-containing protein [Bacteroidales bacterium]